MGEKKYTLMHKNVKVIDLLMDSGVVITIDAVYNINHLPIGIEKINDMPVRSSLNQWWQRRSIPVSRSGLREGLEILGVRDNKELLDKAYGLSLSDQYWINPAENRLEWEKINFFDNEFSDDVGNGLFGIHPDNEKSIDFISPCSASDGWLKKKWKIINGDRILVKGGSEPFIQEPFNELIATALHKRFQLVPFVEYGLIEERGLPYSTCCNFITKETELIPALELLDSKKKKNDVSYFNHLKHICQEYGIKGISDYLDYMITTDYIIANIDRHYNNFGFIRNADTLEFKGIAPIYDSGTSLWFNKADKMITPDKPIEAKPFKPTQEKQIKLVEKFDWLNFSALKGFEEEASAILAKSDYITDQRRTLICNGIKQNINNLKLLVLEKK